MDNKLDISFARGFDFATLDFSVLGESGFKSFFIDFFFEVFDEDVGFVLDTDKCLFKFFASFGSTFSPVDVERYVRGKRAFVFEGIKCNLSVITVLETNEGKLRVIEVLVGSD